MSSDKQQRMEKEQKFTFDKFIKYGLPGKNRRTI